MTRSSKNVRRREWSLYILRCADDSLYTGIAKDVKARLKNHNAGKGSACVRARLPAILLYQENRMTRSQALVREARIKAMPKSQKEKLALINEKPARRIPSRRRQF